MCYDYLENIKEDIKNYMKENGIEDITDDLYDDLFISDYVTGNASGSYYCNAYKAQEALKGNYDLLRDALEMFGETSIPVDRLDDYEYFDVTIRCYLLGQALGELEEEME